MSASLRCPQGVLCLCRRARLFFSVTCSPQYILNIFSTLFVFPHFASSHMIKYKNSLYLMLSCMLSLLKCRVTWFVQSEGQNCWLSLSCAQEDVGDSAAALQILSAPASHLDIVHLSKVMWRFLRTHNLNRNSQVSENETIKRKPTSQIWLQVSCLHM